MRSPRKEYEGPITTGSSVTADLKSRLLYPSEANDPGSGFPSATAATRRSASLREMLQTVMDAPNE